MTKGVYKSALGKPVNMQALMLKNENERAVSNININARGDIIDNMNKPISLKPEQTQNQYKQNLINKDPVTVSKSKDIK